MNTTAPATPAKSTKPAPVDMQAVATGEHRALVHALADLTAKLHLRAGHHIKLPVGAVDAVVLQGPQAGLLAAALELRELLSHSPQGREALHDFGFKPV